MSDPTLTQLRIVVERAVRPVNAGPKKKTQMREELLSHLTTIYDEEFVRLQDESAAMAEATRRFGDPAALTVELQHSLTWGDRFDARLNRLFGRRPGESVARSAARLAMLPALIILFWMCFALVVTEFRRPVDGSAPALGQLLRLFGALLVFVPAAVFGMSLLTVRMRDSIHGAFGTPRSWLRVVALAALAFVLFPALGTSFTLIGLSEASELTKELLTTRGIVSSTVSYFFVALILMGVAWKAGAGQIRQIEWESLEIGQ